MPGSPLSLDGQSFAEAISQFDITQLARLVLLALEAMWSIIVLVYVGRHFGHKRKQKNEKTKFFVGPLKFLTTNIWSST